MNRFLGAPVASMAITGGGALSDSWCQIFADVLGVEIRRDAQPLAVNARGAGWIGAVGTGQLTFADIPGLMRTDRIFVPTPAHRATYDEIFDVYRQLHKRLAPSTAASTNAELLKRPPAAGVLVRLRPWSTPDGTWLSSSAPASWSSSAWAAPSRPGSRVAWWWSRWRSGSSYSRWSTRSANSPAAT
ncbi:hypothetical protein GCM10029963_05990 [Micromonospora andamanensis]